MQIAPITLLDGKATPESHVFQPISNNPAFYQRNGVSGQPVLAFESIKIQVTRGKTPNSANRIDVDLAIPVMEVPAGSNTSGYQAPPSVAHVLNARLHFFVHQRSTKEQRVDLRTMVKNFLENSQLTQAVDNLENAF